MLNWWEIVHLCSINWMVQTLKSDKTTQKIVLGFIDLGYTLKIDGPLFTNKSSVKKRPVMISGRGSTGCV